MSAFKHPFEHEGKTFELHVVKTSHQGLQPALLIFHAWTGQGDLDRNKAQRVAAELGYIGIACDMYGKGIYVTDAIACGKHMTPLMRDRSKLQGLLRANMKAALAVDGVDRNRVAAVGYCFGGLCVLDLARIGENVRAVVSVHGLFKADTSEHPTREKGTEPRILALHGNDDPMVSSDELLAFQREMTELGRDFQVHVYGHTRHGFTNPTATDPSKGVFYSPRAEARAWTSMVNFLTEAFSEVRS